MSSWSCSWCVVVVVLVAVLVRVLARRAKPRAQHARADDHHQQARDQREPGVEVLGQHVLRERERHEAEREHADRVRDRDGRAEQRPRRARCRACRPGRRRPSPCRGRARARAARPSRTPPASSSEQHALAGRGVREQAGEAVRPRRALSAASAARAARARPACRRRGATEKLASRRSSGLGEEVLRVAAQAVRWGRRSARRCGPRCRSPGADDDRLPADPAGEGAVVELDALRGRRRPHARVSSSASGGQAAGAGRGSVSRGRPAGRSATRRPSTVRTRPRSTSSSFRRSTSARPRPRSWTVGISAWSST